MATKQKPIVTSGLEKQLLQQYARSAPLVLVRFKSQAILLASNGVAITAIADVMDKKPRTVKLWLHDWYERRFGSIFTGHQDNNNAGKLTHEQKTEIQQALQSPPSDFGLPKEFWDVPQLKEYVTAQFGIVYECDQSYHFLLKFSNLSFKYPDTFDRKRDEVFIAERMQAIAAELAPLLTDETWEVFASDEVRMDQEAIIRRAWLKRGQKTVVKVNRDKESQSYIGFLNQKNFKCHLYEMPWQNSDEVLKAMEQFLKAYPDKKICIVWDNAAFHKSKAIREQLKTGGLLERVHLIAMPPYAPDNNPIEHVWGVAKQAIANVQYPSFKETKQAFASFVSSRVFEFTF
jgi:transposase